MSFVAAGVAWLLALIAGLVSFVATPYIKKKGGAGDGPEAENHLTPAAAFTSLFQWGNWRQWVLIFVSSLLCTVAVYQLYNAGMPVIALCKHAAVALFLLSGMIIDWKTHRIPNKLIAALFGIGAVLLAIECILYRNTALQTLLSSVIGLLCCFVLFYILSRLTKDGMGMGDVKIIAAMGWVLGVSTALFSVFFAMVFCAIAAVFLLLSKKKKKNDRVPFGPFLFFGYTSMLLLFSF